MIETTGIGPTLSPAYDLVATSLVNPKDNEDLALTLNGKKKKINKSDFVAASKLANLDPKQLENIFDKMKQAKAKWLQQIDKSFLDKAYLSKYKSLIETRFKRLD